MTRGGVLREGGEEGDIIHGHRMRAKEESSDGCQRDREDLVEEVLFWKGIHASMEEKDGHSCRADGLRQEWHEGSGLEELQPLEMRTDTFKAKDESEKNLY